MTFSVEFDGKSAASNVCKHVSAFLLIALVASALHANGQPSKWSNAHALSAAP